MLGDMAAAREVWESTLKGGLARCGARGQVQLADSPIVAEAGWEAALGFVRQGKLWVVGVRVRR